MFKSYILEKKDGMSFVKGVRRAFLFEGVALVGSTVLYKDGNRFGNWFNYDYRWLKTDQYVGVVKSL